MEEKQQEEEKGVQQEDNDGDNDNCDVVRAGSLSVSASVPYSSPSLHQSVCLPACLAWSGLAGPIMVWESVVVRRLAWREDLSLLDGFLISRKGARVIQTSLMFWHPQANGLVTLRLPAVYQYVCVCVWVIADSWNQVKPVCNAAPFIIAKAGEARITFMAAMTAMGIKQAAPARDHPLARSAARPEPQPQPQPELKSHPVQQQQQSASKVLQ